MYRVAQKMAHICAPYNFIECLSIFKLFYCQNQETTCNNMIKDQ